jgi:type IV secretion system protein VirB10
MRILVVLLLLSLFGFSQTQTASSDPQPGLAVGAATPAKPENQPVIPSGSKIPVSLQHAISTKSAKEGDPIYAQTTFPFVMNDHILVPAGTYVQGRISRVQRAGHIKGRAEILIHFTTLVFANGYTVMLPGSIDNIPGTENTRMKDEEGTVQQDSEKGKDAGKIIKDASVGAQGGALIGALASRSAGGTLAGAGAGAALGAAIALFGRGNDVRLEAGSSIEMVIQRDVKLDASRMPQPK